MTPLVPRYMAPGPCGGTYRAFSVRPDLWPPGLFAWVRGNAEDLAWVITATGQESTRRPDSKYSTPGTAEVMILAGMVAIGWNRLDHMDWVPE